MKLSPQFKKIIPYIILVVFGFVLYYQTLSFSFVYLDDNKLILDNYQTLREAGVFKIFTSDVFFSAAGNSFYYRPLLSVSLLLDFFISGTNPFWFHFTNIILHLLSACLVFAIFKKYFFSKKTAYFLAFIFLVHPVMTQAVAWIPGRNDSLLTIFVLTSFYLFLNFLKTDKPVYLWTHLAFFIIALFTKETAVFLPLLCLAYYFLFDYKFSKENKQNNFLIILALWFCAFIIWYLFRAVSLSTGGSINNLFLSGFKNLSTIIIYLGKVIFPFNLSVYPIIQDSTYWYGAGAFLLFILAITLTPKVNYRHLLFGFLWFFIFLIPSFLNPDPGAVFSLFEHRLYLPLIGILICLAEVYPLRNLNWQDKKAQLGGLIIIIIFSVLTILHCQHFSDRLNFWTEAAKKSPNSAFVHNNLGAMYHLNNDLDKAKVEYLIALKINPNQGLVHNNLGLIAVSNKKFTEAESEYKKELEFNPYYDNALTNLGILYFKTNRLTDAKAAFLAAYRLNPNNLEAYNNLLILSAN